MFYRDQRRPLFSNHAERLRHHPPLERRTGGDARMAPSPRPTD